jgi:hypothetical protein
MVIFNMKNYAVDTDKCWLFHIFVKYGSWNRIEKILENKFGYIHLVCTLEMDTDTDIHIACISDRLSIHPLPSLATSVSQPQLPLFSCLLSSPWMNYNVGPMLGRSYLSVILHRRCCVLHIFLIILLLMFSYLVLLVYQPVL